MFISKELILQKSLPYCSCLYAHVDYPFQGFLTFMNGVHVHLMYMHIGQYVILISTYDIVGGKVLYYGF